MPEPYHVLFLCTGNSARSIMAEAILNHEGKGRFVAYSAGSHPKSAPDPFALAVLQRNGFDTGFARSKSWDEFVRPGAQEMDFIFTISAEAEAISNPVWPGQPMVAHWGLPDPAAAEGSDAEKGVVYAAAYGSLLRRIQAFCALPISTIDALTLKGHLRDIGTQPH